MRALEAAEVAALGYEMVLGNTYHLLLSPGPDRIAKLGGLHRFMGWERAIITDSGGFQVFSLAHGAGRRRDQGPRAGRRPESQHVLEISEQGVRFRSYIDGTEHMLSPERSMEVQAALGSDIALAFDECTPYHADRDYTARSTERTHRWLDRCLAWHADNGPQRQAVFGIVQGGVHENLRHESAEAVVGRGRRRRRDRRHTGSREARDVRGARRDPATASDEAPSHLLGIGEPDDLVQGIGRGIDALRLRDPDAPCPPRHGAGAGARVELPDQPPERGDGRGRAARSSRAAGARRASATRAPTSTTWRAPRR